jgi:hypothetical protein
MPAWETTNNVKKLTRFVFFPTKLNRFFSWWWMLAGCN